MSGQQIFSLDRRVSPLLRAIEVAIIPWLAYFRSNVVQIFHFKPGWVGHHLDLITAPHCYHGAYDGPCSSDGVPVQDREAETLQAWPDRD